MFPVSNKNWKNVVGVISREFFLFSLLGMIIAYAIELIKSGFVINFVPAPALFLVVLTTAILTVIYPTDQRKKDKNKFDSFVLAVLSAVSSIIILFFLRRFGGFAYILAVTAGLVIFTMLNSLISDKT